jgi:hypothetical protein
MTIQEIPIVSVPGRIRGHKKLTDPPREVEIEGGPGVSMAHLALPADELEARLRLYEERAAARQPLFGYGPREAAPEDTEWHSCWGCRTATPLKKRGGRVRRAQPIKTPGWLVRKFYGGWMHEVWCPECVAMGGFGRVEEGAA